MTTTIDRAGRLVVPKDIRDRLNLVPGMELDIEVEGDGVRLSVPGAGSSLVDKGGILVHHGAAKAQIDVAEFIRGERESRARRIVPGERGK